MKLWIISDLHLEAFGWRPEDVPDADVCVVAGDVSVGLSWAVAWLRDQVVPHMHCVLVAGNHEHYYTDVPWNLAAGREAAARVPGLQFLENDFWTHRGVRFVGATIWTDFALGAESQADVAWSMQAAAHGMRDYEVIRVPRDRARPPGMAGAIEARFTPGDTLSMHRASRRYVSDVLALPFDGSTVVVTHHAPHPSSLDPAYAGDALNAAFASDLTEVIERWQPDLWVHGHVHCRSDYRVGRTRIVCNPRGYGGENPEFDPGLVVEV